MTIQTMKTWTDGLKFGHPDIIKLGEDQNAAPCRCGSCHLFKRRNDYDIFGLCHLKLPPWTETYFARKDGPWEVDPRTVMDQAWCSFYEPAITDEGSPVKFVQQQTWTAGQEKGRAPR